MSEEKFTRDEVRTMVSSSLRRERRRTDQGLASIRTEISELRIETSRRLDDANHFKQEFGGMLKNIEGTLTKMHLDRLSESELARVADVAQEAELRVRIQELKARRNKTITGIAAAASGMFCWALSNVVWPHLPWSH